VSRPVALITGASSGIGKQFSLQLANKYDLILVARRQHLLEALASELRTNCKTKVDVLEADLADPDLVSRIASRIEAEVISAWSSITRGMVSRANFGRSILLHTRGCIACMS
jgi:short-subunit dehydrogenase